MKDETHVCRPEALVAPLVQLAPLALRAQDQPAPRVQVRQAPLVRKVIQAAQQARLAIRVLLDRLVHSDPRAIRVLLALRASAPLVRLGLRVPLAPRVQLARLVLKAQQDLLDQPAH